MENSKGIIHNKACHRACLSKSGIKNTQLHQLSSFSKSFTTNTVKEGTKRVFLPGCSLAGYSKTIVKEVINYLNNQFEDVDILIQCCGQPSRDIGDKKKFKNQLAKFQQIIDNNHIEQVIVACENCYHIYKKHIKRVEIITIWEIINEVGIPEKLKKHYKVDTKYALHDPCRVRNEEQIHDSIRSILDQLGVSVIEFEKNRDKTVCCGAKNMNHSLKPKLFREIATKRANSTKAVNIVSYCQTCVDALSISGKNTLHVADLLFNYDVIVGKRITQSKNSIYTTWKNRWDIANDR
jgi:Fe-S oxidoreductase